MIPLSFCVLIYVIGLIGWCDSKYISNNEKFRLKSIIVGMMYQLDIVSDVLFVIQLSNFNIDYYYSKW